MTAGPMAKLIEEGRNFFAGEWHSCGLSSPGWRIETLPPMAGVEVAFGPAAPMSANRASINAADRPQRAGAHLTYAGPPTPRN